MAEMTRISDIVEVAKMANRVKRNSISLPAEMTELPCIAKIF